MAADVGKIDGLVHSIAFVKKEDLSGKVYDTSRDGFAMAMDISSYSLIALVGHLKDNLNDGGSVMALTYLGGTQIVPNYNVAGIAKAALESIVRYLAFDLGERGIRVNAISAGPISTASSRQVAGFSAMPAKVAAAAPLRRSDLGRRRRQLRGLSGVRSLEPGHRRRALRRRRLSRHGYVSGSSQSLMDVPSEDELAAIAAAYLMLLREPSPPAPPVSRWRLAARALERRPTAAHGLARCEPLAVKPPFAKILVANRGEIAIRVIRSAKELGCATVAVYSDADRDARHVKLADEAYHLGPATPAQSYLNLEKLLDVARRSGADAVHPGYGFFAESAPFARALIAAGLTWIGPHPDAIDAMGDKVRSRQAMVAAGVPVVPGGTEMLADAAAARDAAGRYGLPLALKASGGGGGKGLKVARTLDEIESAFANAQREAAAYFGNPAIYAERYLENPKHIELQILADKHGHVLHVGERDCSLQRRHQKLWEEAPAAISDRVRDGLRKAGHRCRQSDRLRQRRHDRMPGLGRRVLLPRDEHAHPSRAHGLRDDFGDRPRARTDSRRRGRPLGFDQTAVDAAFRGHAIEVRVNAEDPAQNFRPAPGTLTRYEEPGGFGVRVDSAAFPGFTITPDYDSMIAKLIVWGRDRGEALARLARAIDEYRIGGVPTTLPLLRSLVDFGPVIDAIVRHTNAGTVRRFACRSADRDAPARVRQRRPATSRCAWKSTASSSGYASSICRQSRPARRGRQSPRPNPAPPAKRPSRKETTLRRRCTASSSSYR